MGCSPWGRYKSDTTERLHFHFSLSCIGEGNGNPLQCSCLENPRDRGAWWAAVYGVAQSRTQLKRLSSSRSRHWWSRVCTDSMRTAILGGLTIHPPYPSDLIYGNFSHIQPLSHRGLHEAHLEHTIQSHTSKSSPACCFYSQCPPLTLYLPETSHP